LTDLQHQDSDHDRRFCKGEAALTPQHHCSRATAQTLSLADFIGDNALIANKRNIADKELDKGNIADNVGDSATA
jgi:hypothetical protein